MRERERLLEQQEPSATPDASGQTPPVPDVPVAPQQSQPPFPVQSVPAPSAPVPSMPVAATSPAYAAPRSAGGFGEAVSFPVAPSAPAPQQSPFAPRPVIPAPAPAPAAPVQPPAEAAPYPRPVAEQQPSQPYGLNEATTPERTLTRRELRAMLDANQLDEFDLEDDEIDDPAPLQQPGAAVSFPVGASPTHPVRPDEAIVSPSPAVGHWTDQLNAPVESAEPFDQLLSRGGVSHGVPTTTNALILPTLPDHGSLGGTPLASSGEIIATGSIDLPRSYGATGVHPSRIDSSDVDRLFDQIEEVGTGAAPVAATRAISTQGAARAMIAPPKKEGMNVPLVLAVTAGVLALGVVATLVIGAVAGLF
ncbi:hypothetical protein BJY17_000814 [Agromyces hippuratus]|uniref:Uncharacterized protein n=2 Tax=Agromyces hippuratus TaxID=286438 RepID=A0A852WQN8_9MICO|nr:hypothetical protein [Agromyces hippuratus]NYG20067.1 hypothetical protein [Agromyces hippuratus]